MLLNLKNRTIFTKIILGFTLILVMGGFVAGVLFYGLMDLTEILHQIVDRDVPSIKYPTGVERYALRTILDEKNYLLLEKKEIHRQAGRDIQEIYANLDKVDEVALKYNDQELIRNSKDVRRAVEEYQGYYNAGVVLLEENQLLSNMMRTLGKKAEGLTSLNILRHKKFLGETVIGGKELEKYLAVFFLYNEIQHEILGTRKQEKNCMLYKTQEYFDLLKGHAANLNKLCDELDNMGDFSDNHSFQIEFHEVREKYIEAVENWIANYNSLKEILSRMHLLGIKVQETALTTQETGWLRTDDSKRITELTVRRVLLRGFLAAVITLVIGFLTALFIARGIARPARNLILTTDKIAKGDLNQRVVVKTSDELGRLAAAFNKMTENLKQSRDELILAKDYTDNIIKSMVDALIVVSPDFKIKTMNRSLFDLLGYNESELIGKPIEIIFEKEADIKVIKSERFIKEGELRNYETYYKAKDGRRIPVLFSCSIMKDEDDNMSSIVCTARDIVSRKNAEERQLKLIKELEETNKIMVGRELRMIELKKEIKKLNKELGRPG